MEFDTIAEPTSELMVSETATDDAGELQHEPPEESTPSADGGIYTMAEAQTPQAKEEAETDVVEGDSATPSTEGLSVDEATLSDNDGSAADEKRPLRVLFLSDETGGGHRASAEALGKQFMIQYPGSHVEICNLWTEAGDRVFRSVVKSYKHMSASPWQWKLFYHATNTKVVEVIGKNHCKIFCAEKVKARICEFKPDVVISVHPTMNHLARIQTRLHGKEMGKHIPFYTVVTDLGSAHSVWFEKEVNKIYVASKNLVRLAQQRAIPHENIVLTGLPIRHGFAVQAKALNWDRTLPASKEYIGQVRQTLGLIHEEKDTVEAPTTDEERDSPSAPRSPPMILIMGGGEGVGSLSDIVNQLYSTLTLEGQDATLCVVCGRNATLKEEMENRDWFAVVEASLQERIRKRKVNRSLKERILVGVTNTPPNFCSRDTILCDGSGDLAPNKNNKVDGPKSMEQVMAEAAAVFPDKSLATEKAMEDSRASFTNSPLMQLITKLPGITERKTPQPAENVTTEVTDAAPSDNSFVKDESDDDGEDVGLNPPTTASPQISSPPSIQPGRVNVIGLGFVTNMEEYMVAADVLVTKAGPGTIAEAASVGLPVMLTSFLPGQEAGNVDVVLEAGFGEYCEHPPEIAARVCNWLNEEFILPLMSRKAHKAGHPYAANEIVADIGSETVTWMKMNERWKDDPIYTPFIEFGHTLVLDSYLHDKSAVATLAAISSSNSLANMDKTRRNLATAAGVGVGAAVGAVMAGPLLPIGLVLGSAVFPAVPVGLVLGGAVSGLAANQLGKESTVTSPWRQEEGEGEATDAEGAEVGKEEKKEERDDELPESRFSFGWGSNPTSPVEADVKSPNSVSSNTDTKKANWFDWGNSKGTAEAAADESLVSSTEVEATAAATVTTGPEFVPEAVQG